MEEIEQVLEFIVEIEKLKGVLRKTKPVGLDRYENSAEHSWHVCITALMLKQYSDHDINIDRVIRMLLIHDLGEIDAGDTIIYASESEENKRSEELGITRLLNLLPEGSSQQYLDLWHEFEAGKTPDAKYAKAIDRVPPLLHNLYGNGHGWRENAISPEQVLAVNSRISKGSENLWQVLKSKITSVICDGKFKESFN